MDSKTFDAARYRVVGAVPMTQDTAGALPPRKGSLIHGGRHHMVPRGTLRQMHHAR